MEYKELITHGIAFVSGVLATILGTYLSSWWSESRKSKSDQNKRQKELNSMTSSMPDLIKEMRDDFGSSSNREFIVLSSKSVTYNSKGQHVCYYESEHSDLKQKLHILQNLNLIEDITYNNTQRFKITEEFFEYLNN